MSEPVNDELVILRWVLVVVNVEQSIRQRVLLADPRVHPSSRPADTTAAAARVHLDALRQLGTDGRARLTFALGDSLRAVTEAGVRHRHPDYDDRRVRLAVLRLTLGEALFAGVFPGEDVRP